MHPLARFARTSLCLGLTTGGFLGTLQADTAADKVARLRIAFAPPVQATESAPDQAAAANDPAEEAVTADDVLHLRKMVVTERRQQLIERDLLTSKGKVELAKRQFLTPAYEKTFGPLSQLGAYYFNFLAIFGGWHPNDGEAMALYEDDAQRRRNSEMADLLRLARFSDPNPGQPRWDQPAARPALKAGVLVNGHSTP